MAAQAVRKPFLPAPVRGPLRWKANDAPLPDPEIETQWPHTLEPRLLIISCNFCGVADCQTILSPWPMSVKGPGLNSSPDEEPLDKRTPMPQSIADPLITLRAVYGQRFSCLHGDSTLMLPLFIKQNQQHCSKPHFDCRSVS